MCNLISEGGKQHNHVKGFIFMITVYKCTFVRMCWNVQIWWLRDVFVSPSGCDLYFALCCLSSVLTLLRPELKSCYQPCVCGDLKCPFSKQ
jgi:hypothetical protein